MDCLYILHLLYDSPSGCKSEVVDLVNKIQELLSRSWYVQFDWICRKANKVADEMARYGARNNFNNVIWSGPLRSSLANHYV